MKSAGEPKHLSFMARNRGHHRFLAVKRGGRCGNRDLQIVRNLSPTFFESEGGMQWNNQKSEQTMKEISNLLLYAGLAALSVGCASGPKFSEYRASVPPPPDGYARVWFYRPSAMGAAVQPNVKLDDRVVGSAVPHGFFHAEVKPGEHQVSATTEWTHKGTVAVTTNEDSYVRLNMAMGLFVGHIVPEVMPESKATNQMNGLHFAGKEVQR